MLTAAASDRVRFYAKVGPAGSNGCTEWTAAVGTRGYGRFRIAGRSVAAHRMAFFLATGDIDSAQVICHRCDNPRCVNPAHLFAGTQGDNMRDCEHKGRGRRKTLLTADLVREARDAHRAGASIRGLARLHGVSYSGMRHAIVGKNWTGVT